MDIQPLLTLQEIDGRLRDLDKEIKSMPKRKIEAQKRLAVAAAAVDHAKSAFEILSRAESSYGEEARKQKERAEKAAQNQIALRSMKAFKASALEIDKAEAAAAEATSKFATTHDNLTPQELRLRDAEMTYEQENQLVQEMLDGLSGRKAALEAEQIKVATEREEAVKGINVQDLRYYERLKITRWPSVSEFNRSTGVCAGCNLVQPPSVAQQIRRNDKIVICQSCGRILY